MRINGLLWLWREKPPGDPDATGVSYRPSPRKRWHWLIIFTPSLGLLLYSLLYSLVLRLVWLVLQLLPVTLPVPFSLYEVIDLARWPVFVLACFALGFWWRRRWVGDRFGHGIMAGLAILAFNAGVIVLGSALLVTLGNLIAPLFS
jgi:hypothetical protein